MSNELANIPFVGAVLEQSPFTLVDCGAAGGIDPFFDVLRVFPGSFRYGFEPDPEERKKLKSDHQTQYFGHALSDKVGEATFFASSTMGALTDRSAKLPGHKVTPVTVTVETIDHMVDEGVIRAPDVIKTDVEGHDYAVICGAIGQLEDVLCVKAEIQWQPHSADGGFAAIHYLLVSKGFVLFSHSSNYSYFGALQGGDALYLKSVDAVLADGDASKKRTLLIKLMTLSGTVGFPEYALVVAGKAAEAASVDRILGACVYLPEVFPVTEIGQKLALLAHMLGAILLGYKHRAKSTPKSNQLKPFRRLWVSRGLPIPGASRADLDGRRKAAIAQPIRDA